MAPGQEGPASQEVDALVAWLLEGDVSVQYQTHRTLLGSDAATLAPLRALIATEGWGARLLAGRDPATGTWGGGLYSPKWVSTHYTLLELVGLGVDPAVPEVRASAGVLLDGLWPGPEGRARKRDSPLDTCIAAMLLTIGTYARLGDATLPGGRPGRAVLREIVDHLLNVALGDGGWNCRWWRGENRHSSLHTTISALEALREWEESGDSYRAADARAAAERAWEFLLRHRMYRSERTGEAIDEAMTRLPYPGRWHYDVLRGLDYLASVGAPWDERMRGALDLVLAKRRSDGKWPVQRPYSGTVHFTMEKTGGPSRWNTLRALRVVQAYFPTDRA